MNYKRLSISLCFAIFVSLLYLTHFGLDNKFLFIIFIVFTALSSFLNIVLSFFFGEIDPSFIFPISSFLIIYYLVYPVLQYLIEGFRESNGKNLGSLKGDMIFVSDKNFIPKVEKQTPLMRVAGVLSLILVLAELVFVSLLTFSCGWSVSPCKHIMNMMWIVVAVGFVTSVFYFNKPPFEVENGKNLPFTIKKWMLILFFLLSPFILFMSLMTQ